MLWTAGEHVCNPLDRTADAACHVGKRPPGARDSTIGPTISRLQDRTATSVPLLQGKGDRWGLSSNLAIANWVDEASRIPNHAAVNDGYQHGWGRGGQACFSGYCSGKLVRFTALRFSFVTTSLGYHLYQSNDAVCCMKRLPRVARIVETFRVRLGKPSLFSRGSNQKMGLFYFYFLGWTVRCGM